MKKVISLLLTILIAFSVVTVSPFSVGAEETDSQTSSENILKEGKCGDNAYYTLYSDGFLSITGSGDMYDYAPYMTGTAPWRRNVLSVAIADGITRIGNNAFRSCGDLPSITIPNSVTSIGNEAFAVCDALTSVTIPNSVTSIGDEAFSDCENLSRITIPNSVTSIGNGAFYHCYDLSNITIPDSVTKIGDEMFYACNSLRYFEFPNSVESIGSYAFYKCTSLRDITIPDSVTSIGEGAFSGCTKLTSITIPSSVTSIENSVFSNCTALTSVTIPDTVTSIGNSAFQSCTSLKSITIPNSVKSMGSDTFYGCDALETITLSDSLESIGKKAFYSTGLKSITIPASVTSIGQEAFMFCFDLEWVAILNPDCDIYDEDYTLDFSDTIYGYENSTAQTYAEKYGVKFVVIDDASDAPTVAPATEPTEPPTEAPIIDGIITIYFAKSDWSSVKKVDMLYDYVDVDFCSGQETLTNIVENTGGYDIYEAKLPETVINVYFDGLYPINVIKNGYCYYLKYDENAEVIGYESYPYTPPSTDWPTEEPTEEPTEPPTEEPSEETQAPTEPAKVQNIVGEATPNTVTLTWDLVEGVEKYWIYMYNDATDVWSPMTSAYPEDGSATGLVKNLIPNTTYKFKVTGRYAADKTYLSLDDAQVVEVTTAPPAAPTTLSASLGMGEATISWDEVEGADKYWIYKSKSEDSGYYISNSSLTNSALMVSLKPDTTYYFRITSRTYQNGIPCVSDVMDSPVISVTMPSKEDLATHVPTNTSTTAHVTWNPLANADVDKVWVQYSKISTDTTIAANWTSVKSYTDLSVTSHTLTNLEPGTVYHITVRARYVDSAGVTKSYFYTPKTIRTAYSDEQFLDFNVSGNYLYITLPEIENAEKIWVYAYDQDGNQVKMTSTTTTEALMKIWDGMEDCYFVVEVRDSNGYYTYLTPPGGEKYHT